MKPPSIPPEIEAAVFAWLDLRDQGGFAGPKEEEFLAWIEADPRHLEAFEAYEPIWTQMDRLKRPHLLRAAQPQTVHRPRLGPWWVGASALAAAAVVAMGLFIFHHLPTTQPSLSSLTVFAAHAGEKNVTLPDGSQVRLAPNSEIVTDFAAAERNVRLATGSAHFAVAKNPNRPFIVAAGGVHVQAVGTAFDVHLQPAAVEVAVTEGKVRVDDQHGSSLLPPETPVSPVFAAPVLQAGEKVVIATGLAGPQVARALVPIATAPTAENPVLLEFDGATLENVVATFNARNRHQLVIADDRLRTQVFTGKFHSDSYETLTRLLESSFGVQANNEGDKTVLRFPAEPSR